MSDLTARQVAALLHEERHRMQFTATQATRREEAGRRKKERSEALLREYAEASATFRALTDIRFRLLGLLPAATALAAAYKSGAPAEERLVLALFGLAITIGAITYDRRNDQLYNEVIGRAGQIERELGLHDGSFGNRPVAWLTFRRVVAWPVNHGRAVATIYVATVSLWLFMALHGLASIVARLPFGMRWKAAYLAWLGPDLTPQAAPIAAAALLLAAVLVPLAMVRLLSCEEGLRKRELDANLDAARRLMPPTGQAVRPDSPSYAAFVAACAMVRTPHGVADARVRRAVERRIAASLRESRVSPATLGDADTRAAATLADIVGLPPRYVRDVTARPG